MEIPTPPLGRLLKALVTPPPSDPRSLPSRSVLAKDTHGSWNSLSGEKSALQLTLLLLSPAPPFLGGTGTFFCSKKNQVTYPASLGKGNRRHGCSRGGSVLAYVPALFLATCQGIHTEDLIHPDGCQARQLTPEQTRAADPNATSSPEPIPCRYSQFPVPAYSPGGFRASMSLGDQGPNPHACAV